MNRHPAATTFTATERAVQQLLLGRPLNAMAAAAGIPAEELWAAAATYRHAGSQALRLRVTEQRRDWCQVFVQFRDWTTAEQTAAQHLLPLLDVSGATWWYIRKHPCWRIRARTGTTNPRLAADLAIQLNDLAGRGVIQRWWPGIYEPETTAFGGDDAMAHAHILFAADSHAILNLTHTPAALGRRELWTLMCATLMQAAGLEWYERGDAWHRITRERPLPADVPADNVDGLAGNVHRLLAADLSPGGSLFAADAPLAPLVAWADAFRELGAHLGAANSAGTLHRGLRDVIAYHAIFHANRLGLPARAQSIVAHSARTAVLDVPARHPLPVADQRTGTRPAGHRRASSPPSKTAAPTTAARFPLILQARRRCPSLDVRIAEIAHFADTCRDTTAGDTTRIDRACSVWNLAALAAADCGIPDLAARLCADQFRILHAAWPVTGRVAIAALQPLVNLARLTHRAGDPLSAHRTYEALNRAVRHGGTAHIHGLAVDFDNFARSDSDRADVAAWLRTTLREDGTCALAATGDWAAAAAHAARYDDNPHLLRESRQSRILAAAAANETDAAFALVTTAATSEPWEHAVAACLRVHSAPHAPITDALHTVRCALAEHEARPAIGLFRLRLGLTALDLTPMPQTAEARRLCTALVSDVVDSDDAFLAREALAHPACGAAADTKQRATLEQRIEGAGLGSGSIPSRHLNTVTAATRAAEAVLADILDLPAPRR